MSISNFTKSWKKIRKSLGRNCQRDKDKAYFLFNFLARLYHWYLINNVTFHLISFIPEKECDISCSIISFIYTWERMWCFWFFCIFIYTWERTWYFLFYNIIHIYMRKNVSFFVLFYHSYLREKEYDISGSILSFQKIKFLNTSWCSHRNGEFDLDAYLVQLIR